MNFIWDDSQGYNSTLSLNPNDFDESVCIMIEFITHHCIVVPFTKIRKPKFPLWLLIIAFQRTHVKDDHIEVMLTYERITTITICTFLKEVGVGENQEGFVVSEPNTNQFQVFLNEIGFKRVPMYPRISRSKPFLGCGLC